MSDLISRQAAIDALARTAREKFNLSDEYNQYLAGLMDAQLEIKYLPSAQRTGRWIYNDEAYPGGNPYGHYECDQCGEYVPHKTNYCPNCGADMRGEHDG